MELRIGEKDACTNQVRSNRKDSSTIDTKEIVSAKETFHWRNLTNEVKVKKGTRVLLSHVDGWVKPGRVTALMGSSGARKTALNCLCDSVSTGLITEGVRMVNGKIFGFLHPKINRLLLSTGYSFANTNFQRVFEFFCTLETEPRYVAKQEKYEYVEYNIDLLEMTKYADALVGESGEDINVEQRKRLTIGVELVAKPDLLVFLDEPTSSLDSQTAGSICKLIRMLADNGQAILCTIHQSSAIFMGELDRLLVLKGGGKTVYFGDLGKDCQSLINYFEKYGSSLS